MDNTEIYQLTPQEQEFLTNLEKRITAELVAIIMVYVSECKRFGMEHETMISTLTLFLASTAVRSDMAIRGFSRKEHKSESTKTAEAIQHMMCSEMSSLVDRLIAKRAESN